MASKLERDKQKLIQDKCQQILTELLRDEDNKYCVDCDAKGPRWASWNLGIFLCIRCAGIHRNLGVHISRVKSVNLDSWTPEQVGSIMNMGNSKARAVYEANLPDNFSRPQSDSPLETFIRAKYELKKYIAKEWSETPPKPAFDIDELVKKEKENKKNKIKPTIGLSSSSDIQANPIPRPNASGVTSTAGSAHRSSNSTSQKNITVQAASKPAGDSASVDLLGLDLDTQPNDEPFGFFASANVSGTASTAANSSNNGVPSEKPVKTLEEEEKDFFSQAAPAEEKKLTKESILSLYSKSCGPQTLNTNAGGFAPLVRMPTVNTADNNLTNQFAGLHLYGLNNSPVSAAVPGVNPGVVPATSLAATNTNPFLAASGNSSTTYHLNLASSITAPPFRALPLVTTRPPGMFNNQFCLTSQVNPFVAPMGFDFKPTNGATANASTAGDASEIPAFANFNDFSTDSATTASNSSISKDPPPTSFW